MPRRLNYRRSSFGFPGLVASADAAHKLRRGVTMCGAFALTGLASPAVAESAPRTKLVRCGKESCLQVSGYREDPAAIVSLNDHVVPVEGDNGWRIRLTVEAVRQLSDPHARQITISVKHPGTEEQTSAEADLPIGLLGGTTDLEVIEVRAS